MNYLSSYYGFKPQAMFRFHPLGSLSCCLPAELTVAKSVMTVTTEEVLPRPPPADVENGVYTCHTLAGGGTREAHTETRRRVQVQREHRASIHG